MTSNTFSDQTPPSFIQKHWQKLLALLIWVVIIGGYFWYKIANDLTTLQISLQLVALMQTPLGPLIYIFIYALRPLIFFSAIILTLAAGSIFGAGSIANLILAIIYTVIASNTSSLVAYFIGRYFGEGLLETSDDDTGVIQTYTNRLRENSFETVLIMRLIFLPYDLVTYLCGFLRIDWKAFILATAIGSIPGTVSFVAFGASVNISDIADGQRPEFNPWVIGFGLIIFVASIGLSHYFKKREATKETSSI